MLSRDQLLKFAKSADPEVAADAQKALEALDAASAAEGAKNARAVAIAAVEAECTMPDPRTRGGRMGKPGAENAFHDAFDSGRIALDSWQKGFRRRNGVLPALAGFPMYEEDGKRYTTNPAHFSNTPEGRAAIASGTLTLEPENGR